MREICDGQRLIGKGNGFEVDIRLEIFVVLIHLQDMVDGRCVTRYLNSNIT